MLSRAPEAVPEAALQRDTSQLDDRLALAVLAAAVPVLLSIGIGIVYGVVANVSEPSAAEKNVMYGFSSLVVLGGVWAGLSKTEWTAAVPFRRPSRDELGWAAICFPLGSGAYLAGRSLASAAGLPIGGYEYTLTDPVTLVAVVFGAVLVAPLAEEILFRGLFLGSLLGRGLSPVLAGTATVLAFGVIHFPLLGPGGVVAIVAWSVFPTALRLRYITSPARSCSTSSTTSGVTSSSSCSVSNRRGF